MAVCLSKFFASSPSCILSLLSCIRSRYASIARAHSDLQALNVECTEVGDKLVEAITFGRRLAAWSRETGVCSASPCCPVPHGVVLCCAVLTQHMLIYVVACRACSAVLCIGFFCSVGQCCCAALHCDVLHTLYVHTHGRPLD